MLLGEIGAAQGLKGEVRLKSYTEDPAAIAAYGPLEDKTGKRRFEIETLRPGPKSLIAHIKGITTREAAEALVNTKLYIPRSRLPKHADDEWYHADLIGLAAVDKDGALIGTVVAIHNFGASDIIEVKPEGGASLLIPFTDEAVPDVDIEHRRLVVVPPEEIE